MKSEMDIITRVLHQISHQFRWKMTYTKYVGHDWVRETLDDVRDVVIRSNKNKIKRYQRQITSKLYSVHATKWLNMVNTRGLNC